MSSLYRTPSLSISVNGARLVLTVRHDPTGLPLCLEIPRDALAPLAVAASRALSRVEFPAVCQPYRETRRYLEGKRAANDVGKGVGNG